jgi:transcriptional regulator with XRE-family HTH domain
MVNCMPIIAAMKEQLQAWMDKKGINQVQAAARLGVSGSAFCYWLSGERKPNRVNMQKLAAVTRIKIEDML